MKKIIEIGFVGLIIILAVYFALNWVIGTVVHKRTEVLVPQLNGKSLALAMEILYPLKLGIIKDGDEYNSQIPPATIMRQNPPAGMTVREGKIVRVTLSRGSDLVFVPDLRGQVVKIAEMFLRRNSLEIGARNMFHSLKFAKDEVMWQSLEPNSITEKNTPVDLSVSLGPPPEGILLMPDFVGKNITAFIEWADNNKLKYELKETAETVPSNTVLSQQPAPDTVITFDMSIKAFVFGVDSPQAATIPPGAEIFHYEVPQGSRDLKIRLVLIDSDGERQIFSNVQAPGSKIDIPVSKRGKSRIRVFISNILVEEREL